MSKNPTKLAIARILRRLNPTQERKLFEFMAVPPNTWRGWKQHTNPVAERRIRLVFALERFGLSDGALMSKALSVDAVQAREAISLRAVEMVQVVQVIMNRSDDTAINHTLRFLGGDTNLSSHRMDALKAFLNENRGAVLKADKGFREKYLGDACASVPAVNEEQSGVSESFDVKKNVPVHQTLSLIAAHVKALIPLAEYALSDEVSSEDRRVLRELSGQEKGVFALANFLYMLSSETARKHIARKPLTPPKQEIEKGTQ